MTLDEDQVLIKKTLRGDRRAFEELMRKYEKKIFSFVVRMVHNEDTAVDLTQDFFFKIFTVLEKYNFEYKFSTWAYRICYNLVIDHIRKNQAQVDSLDDETVSTRDMLDSENVSREDGFKALARADLKYEEIAEITSLPVGTVKNRIFKAKEILKQEMEKDGMLV